MKTFKAIPFILILSLSALLFAPGALALTEPELTAGEAYVIDIGSGRVLYSKKADTAVAPASLAKMMTALILCRAVENGSAALTDNVTVYSGVNSGSSGSGSRIGLSPGEVLTFENLLYCVILASGDDACSAASVHVSGSISSFVSEMNALAEELGCANTHFTNANGAPDSDQYTTIADMALIAQQLYDNALFNEICSVSSYSIPATNSSGARTVSNANPLTKTSSKYFYEYAHGILTSPYSAASVATVGDTSVMAIVMDSEKNSSYSDEYTLFKWVSNNFSYHSLLTTGDVVAQAPVSMARDTDSVSLKPKADIEGFAPTDATLDDFTVSYTIYSERDGTALTAPIADGTILGEVTLSDSAGIEYGTVSLVPANQIELSKAAYVKAEIAKTLSSWTVRFIILAVVLLILLYVLVVTRYVKRRRYFEEQELIEQDNADEEDLPDPAAPSGIVYEEDENESAGKPAAPMSPQPDPVPEAVPDEGGEHTSAEASEEDISVDDILNEYREEISSESSPEETDGSSAK